MRRPAPTLLLLGALALAVSALPACFVEIGGFFGPTHSGSIVVITQPSVVFGERLGGACPSTPPFIARFSLVIRDERSVDWRLHEVNVRFVDTHGREGRHHFFGPSDLDALFGSRVIPARGSRSFGFSPRFGCGVDGSGIFHLRVVAVDDDGASEESAVSVIVN